MKTVLQVLAASFEMESNIALGPEASAISLTISAAK